MHRDVIAGVSMHACMHAPSVAPLIAGGAPHGPPQRSSLHACAASALCVTCGAAQVGVFRRGKYQAGKRLGKGNCVNEVRIWARSTPPPRTQLLVAWHAPACSSNAADGYILGSSLDA